MQEIKNGIDRTHLNFNYNYLKEALHMLARQMYNKTLYYTMRNCTNVSPNDTKIHICYY